MVSSIVQLALAPYVVAGMFKSCWLKGQSESSKCHENFANGNCRQGHWYACLVMAFDDFTNLSMHACRYMCAISHCKTIDELVLANTVIYFGSKF